MNLTREIETLNRMLADLDPKTNGATHRRRWHKAGTNRRWILKNVPVRPIKIPAFLDKAERHGLVRGSVYAVLIAMIDSGEVAENRFRREIWRIGGGR